MTDAPRCACGCGRPSPGAHLSGDCTASLRASLELAASIAPDLDDAIARQLKHGGGKSASAEPPLPYDPAASAASQSLRLALMAAMRDALGRLPWPPAVQSTPVTARWLIAHMGIVRQLPRAGNVYHEIRRAVDRAVAVLDAPPERHPAGDCSCGRPLLADARADEAWCSCGMVTTGVGESRRARAAAADVLGDSEAISRALGGLGITVAGGTIRMWVTRHRLTPRPDGQVAMSDVLALVAERDERRRAELTR